MILIEAGLAALLFFSCYQINKRDVLSGMRDGNDGYGSNVGWHWPWTPIVQLCFVGIIICILISM